MTTAPLPGLAREGRNEGALQPAADARGQQGRPQGPAQPSVAPPSEVEREPARDLPAAAFRPGAPLKEQAAVALALRADFPFFAERPGITYLDNAATTQKPACVLQAEADFYRRSCANVHRAIHGLGEEATAIYEGARAELARFVGASPREIVFTSGTTASINLLARSLGEGFRPGDEVLLTEMEHHSNIVPWQMLAAARGIALRFCPLLEDGSLDLVAMERLVGRRTKLVSLTMASNVLGTVNPVASVVEMAHAAGALVALDAAQAAPRTPLEVRALDADFLALSAHKMYGPMGIGLLYGRAELLEAMPPVAGGGGMIEDVTLAGFVPAEAPARFEAGTPPVAQAAGFAAAARWLRAVGLEPLGVYESLLARIFIAGIRDLPDLRIMGEAADRAGIVSFAVAGIHSHDLVARLDKRGFALRAGNHCARPLALRYGIPASARASFGAYNLPEEAADAARAVAAAMGES